MDQKEKDEVVAIVMALRAVFRCTDEAEARGKAVEFVERLEAIANDNGTDNGTTTP